MSSLQGVQGRAEEVSCSRGKASFLKAVEVRVKGRERSGGNGGSSSTIVSIGLHLLSDLSGCLFSFNKRTTKAQFRKLASIIPLEASKYSLTRSIYYQIPGSLLIKLNSTHTINGYDRRRSLTPSFCPPLRQEQALPDTKESYHSL